MKRLLILLVLLFSSHFTISGSYGAAADDFPIEIDGNEELVRIAAELSWSGVGTEVDPYVISGLSVEQSGTLLSFTDTTLYVEIHNNIFASVFEEGVYDYDGIYIKRAANIRILDNEFRDFNHAINLEHATNITISGNWITDEFVGHYGVYMDPDARSSNITIEKNEIEKMEWGVFDSSNFSLIASNKLTGASMHLRHSYNNTIVGNRIDEGGFELLDPQYNEYVNNTVNDLPLFVGYALETVVIADPVGQIILTRSANVTIRNQVFHGVHPSAIVLYGTSDVIIENSRFSENHHSIMILNSDQIKVHNNSFVNVQRGDGLILVESSHDNVFSSNTFKNIDVGIYFAFEHSNNQVIDNHFEEMTEAIIINGYLSSVVIKGNVFLNVDSPVSVSMQNEVDNTDALDESNIISSSDTSPLYFHTINILFGVVLSYQFRRGKEKQ